MGLYVEASKSFEDDRLVVYATVPESDVGELTIAVAKSDPPDRFVTAPTDQHDRAVGYLLAKARRQVTPAGEWPARVMLAG